MRFDLATAVLAWQAFPVPASSSSSSTIENNKNKKFQPFASAFFGSNEKALLSASTAGGGQRARNNPRRSRNNGASLLMNSKNNDRHHKTKEVAARECDPNALDMGVLACGSGNYCVESQSSSKGGICHFHETTTGITSSRRLQSYDNCDYSGIDYETLYGTLVCSGDSQYCTVMDAGFDCCYSYETTKVYGPEAYYSNMMTYVFRTPYSQNVTINSVVNSGNGDGDSCEISFNGEVCNSCEVVPSDDGYGFCYEFDCSNNPPGVVGTTCDGEREPLIPILGQCFGGSGCNMCGDGNTLDFPDSILGEYNVPCTAVYAYMMNNAAERSSYCEYAQEYFSPICCEGAAACNICGDGPLLYPNRTVEIPDTGEITCDALFFRGSFGFIDTEECSLVTYTAGPICCMEEAEPCLVCPGDAPVTNPDNPIQTPGQPNVSCEQLQEFGRLGRIPEDLCVPAQSAVPAICGCGPVQSTDVPVETTPPAASPTSDPQTKPPTDPPTEPPAGGESGSSSWYYCKGFISLMCLSLALVSYVTP